MEKKKKEEEIVTEEVVVTEETRETSLDDVIAALQELTKAITTLTKEQGKLKEVIEKYNRAGKF